MSELLFASSLGYAQPVPKQSVPIGPKPGELTTVRGFQLSITAPHEQFYGGYPIDIEARVTNVTDKVIYLGINPDPLIWKAEVTDEKGEHLPLTRYGQSLPTAAGTHIGIGLMDMAPGDSDKASLRVSRLYDMSAPGVYLVKVKHGIFTQGDKDFAEATSNVLRIIVR